MSKPVSLPKLRFACERLHTLHTTHGLNDFSYECMACGLEFIIYVTTYTFDTHIGFDWLIYLFIEYKRN